MLTRLFLFPKDLMNIENISITTAYKRYNELLFLLNKPLKSNLPLNNILNIITYNQEKFQILFTKYIIFKQKNFTFTS